MIHNTGRPVMWRGRYCRLTDFNMPDSTDMLPQHIDTTAEIVAAYVARNSVPAAELPNLIRSVHDSLSKLGSAPAVEAPTAPLVPAISAKKSITDEYIISLEDGRKFKSMKRYLAGLGMTPAEYRAKWGLPVDYPMVAPAYAAKRSALAKTIGLGRKGIESIVTVPAAAASPDASAAPVGEAVEPGEDRGKKPRKRAAKAA